ncbi:MAG: hypothetical protein K0R28_3922 [Paenibacillus sp.]|nr:hypothetical protein [Paenibacillus sp.]
MTSWTVLTQRFIPPNARDDIDQFRELAVVGEKPIQRLEKGRKPGL